MRRLLASLCLATLAAAQDTRPERSWMPLALGSQWKMRVTGGEKPIVDTMVCAAARLTRFGIAFGTHEGGGTKRLSWLVLARDGLYALEDKQLGASSEGTLCFQMRVLALPLGAVLKWQVEMESEPTTERTAELVAMRDKVVVPAGTFEAACVRITRRHEAEIATERTFWFARGIGVVRIDAERRDAAGKTQHRIFELESFEPPKAGGSLDEIVRQAVSLHPHGKTLGEIAAIEELRDDALLVLAPLRVARARCKGGELLFLVRDALAFELAPAEADTWNGILAARAKPEPPDVELRAALARACAHLLAAPIAKVELKWRDGWVEEVVKK